MCSLLQLVKDLTKWSYVSTSHESMNHSKFLTSVFLTGPENRCRHHFRSKCAKNSAFKKSHRLIGFAFCVPTLYFHPQKDFTPTSYLTDGQMEVEEASRFWTHRVNRSKICKSKTSIRMLRFYKVWMKPFLSLFKHFWLQN